MTFDNVLHNINFTITCIEKIILVYKCIKCLLRKKSYNCHTLKCNKHMYVGIYTYFLFNFIKNNSLFSSDFFDVSHKLWCKFKNAFNSQIGKMLYIHYKIYLLYKNQAADACFLFTRSQEKKNYTTLQGKSKNRAGNYIDNCCCLHNEMPNL